MRRFIAALLLAALSFTAHADIYQARYGVAETFDFWLFNADGTLDIDEVDSGTEVSLACNEGAETTATNDFVDEGTFYSIALTAAEMQCERITVVVSATVVGGFIIQTHSNASAMTPTNDVNVVNAAGTAWNSGAIGATTLAADTITAATVATDVSTEFSAATFTVNTTQISGDSAVADRFEAMLDSTCGSYPELGVTRGVGCTAQAYTAGTPSITLDASAAFGDNTLTGATILICGSTQGYCQPALAASNVGASDVVTLAAALPVAATGTITYTIFGTAAASGGASAADVWSYVGGRTLTSLDEDTTTIDLNASALGSVAGAVGSVTGNVGGNVIGFVGSVNTNGISAASLAADAGTELATANWAATTRELTSGLNIVLAKGAGITGFNDLSAAQVNIEADTALSDIHLNRLFAVDYDPASKPGVAGAWINEVSENDLGAIRYTTEVLENAPAGGGGGTADWSVGEREQIRHRIGIDGTASAPSATPSLASAASIAALNNLSAVQVRDSVSEDQGNVSRGCIEAVLLSFAAGDISTSGQTTTWRDPSNGEVRITSVVTSNGNRTATISCPTY